MHGLADLSPVVTPKNQKDDSPNAPYINLATVLPCSEEQLGRSVPPRYNAICIPLLLALRVASCRGEDDRRIKRAGETKIGYTQRSSIGDKQVGSFHITVEDVILHEWVR